MRQVSPLRRQRNEPDPAEPEIAQPEPMPAAAPRVATARPAKPASPAPPPLAPLERRLRQRLGRGSEAPDARIDLHGMTQERAHRALLNFLRGAQADGARVVLVITGKGARGGEAGSEGGVLRRAVPQWLALPEFRPLVVGYDTAHIGHGGEGALYVRVRRGRREG